jgi:hypothetical protein
MALQALVSSGSRTVRRCELVYSTIQRASCPYLRPLRRASVADDPVADAPPAPLPSASAVDDDEDEEGAPPVTAADTPVPLSIALEGAVTAVAVGALGAVGGTGTGIATATSSRAVPPPALWLRLATWGARSASSRPQRSSNGATSDARDVS